MKKILSTALRAIVAGLCFAVSAALALSITGRDTQFQRSVLQSGISAMTPELSITATPSGSQTTSYQLSAGVSQVVTVASSGDGVRLVSTTALGAPTNVDASLNMIVINAHASNAVNMFPFASTDVIVNNGSAGGAGAALSIPALKNADCWSVSTGKWYCTIG